MSRCKRTKQTKRRKTSSKRVVEAREKAHKATSDKYQEEIEKVQNKFRRIFQEQEKEWVKPQPRRRSDDGKKKGKKSYHVESEKEEFVPEDEQGPSSGKGTKLW